MTHYIIRLQEFLKLSRGVKVSCQDWMKSPIQDTK